MTIIYKRTFEASKHPPGAERERLNRDARTSEYMPSQRYTVVLPTGRQSFRTRREAEAFVDRQGR